MPEGEDKEAGKAEGEAGTPGESGENSQDGENGKNGNERGINSGGHPLGGRGVPRGNFRGFFIYY